MISSSEVKAILDKLKIYLHESYGSKIKLTILYGSYARNEIREDSDMDVLVVVDKEVNPFSVRRKISDFLLDILLKYEIVLSVIVVPQSLYNEYKSPLFLNVKEEGIII